MGLDLNGYARICLNHGMPLGAFELRTACPPPCGLWFRVAGAAGLAVRVSHHAQSTPPAPVVQFNLYGGTAEGFFCPEPFIGVQNSLNKRIGLIELAPGKSWTWLIGVEPERTLP